MFGGGGTGHRVDIEDERDRTVAEDGGPRDPGDGADVLAQALDHDLLLAEDLIDGQAEALAVFALDDEDRLFRALAGLPVEHGSRRTGGTISPRSASTSPDPGTLSLGLPATTHSMMLARGTT